MITIYYANISEKSHNELMNKYLHNFSMKYQERLKRYRRWEDAQLSLLGRVLLMNGLEQRNFQFNDSKLKYTAFNKPFFDDNVGVHFNISHSGNKVVCVLTELEEIGIDIEKMETIEISIFKPQMTSNEWNLINESENSIHAFYTYWSQKEAVIKAHGEGLSIPLKSFEINNNQTTIGAEQFYLREIFISNDYGCHIASKEKLEAINIQINEINF